MLYWKNKRIDHLDQDELRAALTQTVGLLLSDKPNIETGAILPAFLTGLFGGILLASLIIASLWML